MSATSSGGSLASRAANDYGSDEAGDHLLRITVFGDTAPSPSVPLPEGEGRKLLLPRGEGGDEGAILNLTLDCNEFGKAQSLSVTVVSKAVAARAKGWCSIVVIDTGPSPLRMSWRAAPSFAATVSSRAMSKRGGKRLSRAASAYGLVMAVTRERSLKKTQCTAIAGPALFGIVHRLKELIRARGIGAGIKARDYSELQRKSTVLSRPPTATLRFTALPPKVATT